MSQQLYAALSKNWTIKRRAWVSTLLEVVFPSLFVTLLAVGYWSSDNTHYPAKNYDGPLFDPNVAVFNSGALCLRKSVNSSLSLPLSRCRPGTPDKFCLKQVGEEVCVTNALALDTLVELLDRMQQPCKPFGLDAFILLSAYVHQFHSNWEQFMRRSVRMSLFHAGELGVAGPPQNAMPLVHYCTRASALCSRIVRTFPTVDEAVAYSVQTSKLWAVIDATALNPPFENTVTIRMNYTATPWTFDRVNIFSTGLGSRDYMLYVASGFVTVESLVHEYILDAAGEHTVEHVAFTPFPTEAHTANDFLTESGMYVPLILTFGFLFSLSRWLSTIVQEKELRIREAVLIMGLKRSTFYSSWVLTDAAFCLASTTCSSIAAKLTFYANVDFWLLWIVMSLFGLSLVFFSLLLSVFFSRARMATVLGPLVMFACSVPHYAIPNGTDVQYRLLASLFPCPAFSQAINMLTNFVSTGTNAGWNVAHVGEYSIFMCLGVMAANGALYAFLAWYLDNVLPSEYGVRKHPLFVFEPLLKKISLRGSDVASDEGRESAFVEEHQNYDGFFEETVQSTAPVVCMHNVSRLYPREGGTTVAVNNVSMKLFPGNVNVLLGHNGAGKSTTINMLVGLTEPSRGRITVFGKDAAKSMAEIRRSIGYCPQHSVLWPTLTTREHLQFYARVKGVVNVDQTVSEAMQMYHLDDVQACTLSGGQMRKLCVAIAFMGPNQFVLLDEPSAGVDVEGRRALWDVILKQRQSRCILLSTHYMDEADLLGDRVIIMNSGRIHSSGSPLFLKSRFGIGYTLRLLLNDNASVKKLVNFISDIVGVPQHEELHYAIQHPELLIKLPSTFPEKAHEALTQIESQKETFGVRTIGLSLCTMDDVFNEIASTHETLIPLQNQSVQSVAKAYVCDVNEPTEHLLQGTQKIEKSFARDFVALFRKRVQCARRDRRTLCFQIVIPVVFLVIALLLLLVQPPTQPPLALNSDMYLTRPAEIAFTASPPARAALIHSMSSPGYTEVGPISCNYTEDACISALSLYLASNLRNHSFPRFVAVVPFANYLSANGAVVLLHNASGLHSLPESLNVLTTALLRNATRTGACVNTINHPLPMSEHEQRLVDSIRMIVSSVFILIPFTFIPANFVSFIVRERETHASHLQWLCGAGAASYWLASFAFDALTYLLTEFIAIVVFVVFQRNEFTGDAATFAATACLFFVYGLSTIVLSYCISFAFHNHITAQNTVLMCNFFFGFMLVMGSQILSAVKSTRYVNQKLCIVFRCIPSFALGEGIITLTGRKLATILLGYEPGAFEPLIYLNDYGGFLGGIGTSLYYLCGTTPMFFALLFVLVKIHNSRLRSATLHAPQEQACSDDDVTAEAARVESIIAEQQGSRYGVIVHKLNKNFGQKVVVHDLSFAVESGEIFALLGTNGAGKTTTMSIVTGEQQPTSGEALVCGHSVLREADCVRRLMGFCPQHDALLDYMTPREQLALYARLRGIPEEAVSTEVSRYLTMLDLTPYRNVVTTSLSGGTKRKLSLAIALIGGTDVVLLDEPTAGMDPVSRKQLWAFLKEIAKTRSIILTTHHLEEVEALANRVGILVDGRLRCVGSLQQLKNKYSAGRYEVQFALTATQPLQEFLCVVKSVIKSVEVLEIKRNQVTLAVKSDSLSQLFADIQQIKSTTSIEDYSVNQTSLEHVFLRVSHNHA